MPKWNFVALSEVCNIEKGKTGLMKAEQGEYPLVATGQERRTCNTYQFDAKAVCIPLVSSTGHGHASLKYVHYQEGKFALGTILAAVIPKDENILNAQFLHLYLSRLKDELLVPLMTGAANVTLTVTKLKTVKVPLPPIDEQLRIVSLFNRMDSEQKELVDEIETQQILLKKLRKSILQEAIGGKLTKAWREAHADVEPASVLLEKIKAEKEQMVKDKKIRKQKPLPPIADEEKPFEIPEGWEWCRLGETGNVLRGKSPKYDKNSNTLSINQKCVRWGYIDLAYGKGINQTWFESIDPTILTAKNDILVNSTGDGTIGRSAIVKNENKGYIYDSHVLLFRPIYTESKYLVSIINSDFVQYQIENLKGAKSTKQTELGVEKLRSVIIPVPPLEEQKEIVKKIESLFKICDELEAQIAYAKADSEMLMQAVLREAFEPKQTMEKIGDDEKAMTAMSYIIDNIESEKLGRVKLQKIFYMYSAANNEYFGFNYKNKHAMGPHDKVRMDTIEAKIEEVKWFKKVRTGEGERNRFDYVPLSNKNDYKKFLSQLPNKKEFDRIISLMRPLDLARSEVIATLYAVWQEETSLFGVVEDAIIIGKAKEWHQNKKKYTNDHWKWGMKWLRDNRFIA